MKVLENAGFLNRDCVQALWFSDAEPNIPSFKYTTDEAKQECRQSLRLLEEVSEEQGLFRTYRCSHDGRDMEISFSVAKNGRDRGLFTWCEFAVSIDEPFQEDKRYTDIRSM